MPLVPNLAIIWLTNNIYLPPPFFLRLLSSSLGLLIASEACSFYLGSALFKICASVSFLTAGVAQSEIITSDFVTLPRVPSYSFAIILGLGFSLLGDALLIPTPTIYYSTARNFRSNTDPGANISSTSPGAAVMEVHEAVTTTFKLGIFFFALAHVAYIVAFLSFASSQGSLSLAEVLVDPSHFRPTYFITSFAFGLLVASYLGLLRQSETSESRGLIVPDDLQLLVKVYIGIIITMASVAAATDDGWQRILGAWMFMVSDLFVALDVFGPKLDGGDNTSGQGRTGWQTRSVGWMIYFWAQMLLAGTV